MHESNTFNPLRTDRAAFAAQSLTFGPALLDEWRDAHHEVGGFLEARRREGFEPVPLAHGLGDAVRSGRRRRASTRSPAAHRRRRRERPDGLLLALHGAMVAESHLDADGEVLARLRPALGPDFPSSSRSICTATCRSG